MGGFHHRHRAARRNRGGGDLQPDDTASDDDNPDARHETVVDGPRIPDGAQVADWNGRSFQRRTPPRRHPGCQKQPVEPRSATIGDTHLATVRIHGDHGCAAPEIDALRSPVFSGFDELHRRTGLSKQFIGQLRSFMGQMRLGTDQRDRALMACAAQREGCASARLTGADDHDPHASASGHPVTVTARRAIAAPSG